MVRGKSKKYQWVSDDFKRVSNVNIIHSMKVHIFRSDETGHKVPQCGEKRDNFTLGLRGHFYLAEKTHTSPIN